MTFNEASQRLSRIGLTEHDVRQLWRVQTRDVIIQDLLDEFEQSCIIADQKIDGYYVTEPTLP